MSTWPPPTEILPIFNSSVFSSGDSNLTVTEGDSRYVNLFGAQTINVAKTFNNTNLKIKDTTGGGTATVNYTSAGDSTNFNFLSNGVGGTQFIVSDLVSMPLYNKNLSDATNTFPRSYYIVYGNSSSVAVGSSASYTFFTNNLWNGSTVNNSSIISWTAATGAFTVSQAGLYLVHASCSLSQGSSSAQRAFRISASDGQEAANVGSDDSNVAPIPVSVTAMFLLNANDTIRTSGFQTTGVSRNFLTGASPTNKFICYKIL